MPYRNGKNWRTAVKAGEIGRHDTKAEIDDGELRESLCTDRKFRRKIHTHTDAFGRVSSFLSGGLE